MSFMPSAVTRVEALTATKPLLDLLGLTEFEVYEVAVKADRIEVVAAPVYPDGSPERLPTPLDLQEGDARVFSDFCYTAHVEIVDAEVKA